MRVSCSHELEAYAVFTYCAKLQQCNMEINIMKLNNLDMFKNVGILVKVSLDLLNNTNDMVKLSNTIHQ